MTHSPPQLISSLPSKHSAFPSHCHLVGMQRDLSAHWNCLVEHVVVSAVEVKCYDFLSI